MINLFNRDYPIQHGVTRSSSWDNVIKYYKNDLNLIDSKYKSMEKRVNNDHILVRLIKHIDIDFTKNIFDYVTALDTTYMFTIKDMHVSSSINKGKIINKEIISDSDSLLINTDFEIDLFNADLTYLNIPSIRILYHDGIGLSMNHPSKIGELINYTVFDIDVKLLMVQYKIWALKRVELDYDVDPAVFVYTILLTNLIPSFLETSILNRFFLIEDEMEDIKSTHLFNTRDLYSITDKELLYLKKRLYRKKMYYEEFLKSIPMVFSKDAYETLHVSSRVLNSNNLWSNYLGRSEYILYILEALGNRGIKKNSNHVNDLNRVMRRLKSSNKLDTIDLRNGEILIMFTYERLLEITEDRSL